MLTASRRSYLSCALALVLAVFTAGLLSLAAAAADKPAYGGKLVVAVPADPDTLDPHKYVAAGTGEMLYNVFEGLVTFTPSGTLIPALATAWQVSSDAKTYSFDIRKGVVFHDGRKLTSADAKYSFERMMDKTTGYPRDWAHDVATVAAPSAYKLVVTLTKPSVPFLADIVDAAIIPKDSGPTQKAKPVGTGAFRIVKWLPGQEVRLEKFGQYWRKGLPYLDQVTFRVMPAEATALIALKAKAVDIIPRVTGVQATSALKDKSIRTVTALMNLVALAPINTGHKPFDDVRVRQAMCYGVDRDEIIAGASAGIGTKVGSNMSPAMTAWYTDLANYYKPDITKAKELLKAAGYPKGFSATITLPSVYQIYVDTGQLMAAQLAKVGIDLKIELVDWPTWLDRVYMKRDFDMTVIGFEGKLDPHLVLSRYDSAYPQNLMNYSNSEFDTLLHKGEVTTDQPERHKIYQRLQTILAADAPAIFLMDPGTVSAIRPEVRGWTIYSKYVADVVRVYLAK